MSGWSFITNHTRVLQCIASDGGARLRDIAACADLTERTTHTIVSDLCRDGYVSKRRVGTRNFYEIHPEQPLKGGGGEGRTVGDLLRALGEHPAHAGVQAG